MFANSNFTSTCCLLFGKFIFHQILFGSFDCESSMNQNEFVKVYYFTSLTNRIFDALPLFRFLASNPRGKKPN